MEELLEPYVQVIFIKTINRMGINRNPLPGATIPIVPLSQPCPVSFLFLELRYMGGCFNFLRKHADVRTTP